jgi:AcrR family transcriptional regulator
MEQASRRRRGRPTGEGEQGAATRTAILDAAERRFADDGASARLQDIAEDVGKTAPTVFHFFKDKAALQQAVIERLAADFAGHLQARALHPGSGSVSRAMALIEAVITFMRKRPALLGFILRDMAEGRLHPLSAASWTEVSAPYAHLLEEAVLEDATALNVDATINVAIGPTVLFMVRTARYSDIEFQAAAGVHLHVTRRALAAVLASV